MFMNSQKYKWNIFCCSEYKYEVVIKLTGAENVI